MIQFTEFMDKYFFDIWLVLLVVILSSFYVKGKRAMKLFDGLDLSHTIYSEKNASGFSTSSFRNRYGGASKTLHIVITDKELILKTFWLFAGIAKKHDMLHRIPLEKILSTEIKEGPIFSKLFVRFTGENGEQKEIVLMSGKNEHIQQLLDRS